MSTDNSHYGEAYIIEEDGTKTSIPIGFADAKNARPHEAGASASQPQGSSSRGSGGFAGSQPQWPGGANGPYAGGNPYVNAGPQAGQSGPRVVFTTFPPMGSGPYAGPQTPGADVNPKPVSRFKLHLGRRIFGLFLVFIGLPMLLLPGPGLFCILLGLSLVLAP